MEQEKVGKFIKHIRIKNKLTQKEFADKFGVTYQAVSKWENGKNLPDINILKEICIEYNISLDEVLNGDKKEETKQAAKSDEVKLLEEIRDLLKKENKKETKKKSTKTK